MDKPVRDPLPALLMVLTVVTGLVDAISVLGLGRVFTANMTGNVVFLGFAVAGAPGFSIPRCLVALVGFVAGAALGGRLGFALSSGTRRRWLLTVAVVESGLFLAAALLAPRYDMDTLKTSTQLYGLIALTAVAMGLRNATVRRLAVPELTTTVLTLTVTALAAESALAGGSNPRWTRRIGSVVAIFVGAAIGAWLLFTAGLIVTLIITGAAILLATLAYAAHPASASAAQPAGK